MLRLVSRRSGSSGFVGEFFFSFPVSYINSLDKFLESCEGVRLVLVDHIVVRNKCTALLNQKHGRFGKVWALASAHALCLTTYYHVPEYFE